MKRIEKLTAEHLVIYLANTYYFYALQKELGQGNKKCEKVILIGFSNNSDYIDYDYIVNDHNTVSCQCFYNQVKPILRTRKSITPEELETFSICFRMWYDKPSFDYNLMVYSDVVQMAKLHIDIFGLIESGLAVDKETIKKE